MKTTTLLRALLRRKELTRLSVRRGALASDERDELEEVNRQIREAERDMEPTYSFPAYVATLRRHVHDRPR